MRQRHVAPYARKIRDALRVNEHGCSGDGEGVAARGRLGLYPCVAFVVGYATFLAAGGAALALPPRARSSVAGQSVPNDARCYRAVRKADYTAVELALGSPARRMLVLLRLDKAVHDGELSINLFNTRIVESATLQCSTDTEGLGTTCRDVVLTTAKGDPNAELARAVIEFGYTNSQRIQPASGLATAYGLGLHGEMFAAEGYRYYLTNTHLCVSSDTNATAGNTDGALHAYASTSETSSNNNFLANMTSVISVDLLSASPLHTPRLEDSCASFLSEEVDVFPFAAGLESNYLSLVDTNLYDVEPDAVRTRRRVVELGAACANRLTEYNHSYSLYEVDCQSLCRERPSLPYRRIATFGVRVHYTADGRAYFWFFKDSTLRTLPGLANTGDAVLMAVVKLGLITLAAAVTWIRSGRVTSKPHWMYRHCIAVANCHPRPASSSVGALRSSVVEDALLGLVAVGARFGIAWWRLDSLSHDDQTRVCVFELVAATVSLVSWVVRYWVIKPNLLAFVNEAFADGQGPLARLGGSMAIADASSASLLAFAEAPLLLSATSRFDATARLLTGLLVTLVTLNRCLFACCCNAIVYEAHEVGRLVSGPTYKALVVAAGVGWLVQIATLGVSVADLVATPMATALRRGVVGESGAIGPATFMLFVGASLPRLLHTLVKIAKPDSKRLHL